MTSAIDRGAEADEQGVDHRPLVRLGVARNAEVVPGEGAEPGVARPGHLGGDERDEHEDHRQQDQDGQDGQHAPARGFPCGTLPRGGVPPLRGGRGWGPGGLASGWSRLAASCRPPPQAGSGLRRRASTCAAGTSAGRTCTVSGATVAQSACRRSRSARRPGGDEDVDLGTVFQRQPVADAAALEAGDAHGARPSSLSAAGRVRAEHEVLGADAQLQVLAVRAASAGWSEIGGTRDLWHVTWPSASSVAGSRRCWTRRGSRRSTWSTGAA